ncbi:MAG: hypothetical protein AB7O62_04450 [Pirellulales bacterium]
MALEREEYVEQAYLFRALADRMTQSVATQDLMLGIREELLATTKLPLAVQFMVGELKLQGVLAPAMAKLSHYFTPFQTYVMAEAESESGRFDFGVALEVLHREAAYRAEGCSPQGIFLYQFEVLCRNRLGYDKGIAAIAADPAYDADWREWLMVVRRQVGLVDLSDLVYVRSGFYLKQRQQQTGLAAEPEKPVLFGEKEGRIAFANRHKDPLYLFAALQRHLNYPQVPRHKPVDESRQMIPLLMRRMERVEMRIKLLEEEGKGGIDLNKLYGQMRDLADE